jgi:hypothetical protein
MALAISYNTSYHSTIATEPFELLFWEKARLPSFPNEDIQQIHYGETSAAELFNLLQKLLAKAHKFETEDSEKSKSNFDKEACDHKFQIGDKVLISDDFYMGKNPKLVPAFKGLGEIIDINDTNALVKIGNKIKVLNVNKLKLFQQEKTSETDTKLQDLNFLDYHTDGSITFAHARLINYKNAVHLALLMLNEEGGVNIDSLCDQPCVACDSENDYFKLNPPQWNFAQACQECDKYAKLFVKLKEHKDQCVQLKTQIDFAHQHQLHKNFNQIKKSMEMQVKTGIAESLHEPLMKIAHKLLISDKSTFEQLTPS